MCIHTHVHVHTYIHMYTYDCTCYDSCMMYIQVLVEADVAGTARLVLMDFPLELSEVTHRLQATPDLQFRLLQGIFDPK